MKNIIITILVMLVLGLGGFLVYDKVIDKKEEVSNQEETNEKVENAEENVYTYKDVAGNYYYEQEVKDDERPGLMQRFGLILSEDGTFSYTQAIDAAGGVIGNYMINGNVITLNYIATTASDVSLVPVFDKTHTLIINEDKSITDENVEDRKSVV